jgi:hypothetical protein
MMESGQTQDEWLSLEYQNLKILLVYLDKGSHFWKSALCVINSWRMGYASLTPLMHQVGEFMALDVQIGTVISHGLQGQ